jgi:hypothetical protein
MRVRPFDAGSITIFGLGTGGGGLTLWANLAKFRPYYYKGDR